MKGFEVTHYGSGMGFGDVREGDGRGEKGVWKKLNFLRPASYI